MSFFEYVQKGKISHPVYKSFSSDTWDVGYRERRATVDCDRIYNAGRIIFAILNVLRHANSSIPKWCPTDKHISYLVGLCNRDVVTLSRLAENILSESKDPFINELEHFKVPLSTGAMVKPDEVNSSSVDALSTVIPDVLTNSAVEKTDALTDLEKLTCLTAQLNLCNTYQWIESLWRDCLWNGYGFTINSSSDFVIEPQSEKAHLIAKITVATKYREKMFRHHFVGLMGIRWNKWMGDVEKKRLSQLKFVTEITRTGKSRVVHLSSEKHDELADQARFEAMATKELVRKEYYEEILLPPVSKLGGETVETLFDVWLVLRSLSRATAKRLSDSSLYSPSAALSFSVSYARKEMVNLVHRATAIEVARVNILLEFLTFRKSPDTLWSRPLVEVAGNRLALPFAALHQSEPLFVLESWLPMLSLNVGAKGNPFEREVRSSLKTITKSPLIERIFSIFESDFVFHPNKKGERNEEIDLVFVINRTVYIGEIKCSVTPMEDIDFFNNRSIILGAVQQAKRKCASVQRNLAVFVNQLRKRGFHVSLDSTIKPLVVTNNLINSGYPVEGVPVVDIPILERYLEGNITELAYNAGINPLSIKKFYNSSQEAEHHIAEYFDNPPQLLDIKSGVRVRELSIPANLFDERIPRLTLREYEVIVDIDEVKKRLGFEGVMPS